MNELMNVYVRDRVGQTIFSSSSSTSFSQSPLRGGIPNPKGTVKSYFYLFFHLDKKMCRVERLVVLILIILGEKIRFD